MSQKIRIKLKSYDHNLVDKSAEKIVKTVKSTGAIVSGPIPLPTHKRIYTVLRSPHVNKKAQDQFEFRVYRKQLSLYSYQGLKLLMILKKIQCKLFADVKIKIEFVLNENKFYKETHKKFNPNKFSSKKNKVNSLSSKSYLQLLCMVNFYPRHCKR